MARPGERGASEHEQRHLTAPPCGPAVTGRDGDHNLLIASDLPLRSAPLQTAVPMTQAIEFALREHHFRAGRFRLGGIGHAGAWLL